MMRIVYCIDSINGTGGIQKVTITKANALSGLPGYEVWIALADNSGRRRFEVSPRVHVVDLAVNYYADDWKSDWHVLKGILVKRPRHKKRLEALLRQIQPDVVVSVGESEKFFLPTIRGPWATVREFHYMKDYRWRSAGSSFDKLLALGGDFIDYALRIRRYDQIVVQTEEDRLTHWKGNPKVVTIPNPVEMESPVRAALDAKRIIALGRLVPPKDFSSLIRAFRIVADRYPDWRLEIFGDGPERAALEGLISSLSLQKNVRLRKSTENVTGELLASSTLALSSRFEGFGLVLVEAMQLGVPVVAYACPCGPRDIISDGKDGLLVPPGDEPALADALCALIGDEALRKRMGAQALESSKRYRLGPVIDSWVALFTRLTGKGTAGTAGE